MYPRHLRHDLLAALSDSPVVFLVGPRQVGKTTLVRGLAAAEHPARYFTLDDATSRAALTHDPEGFLRAFDGPVVLDEVQRAPGLFLALKGEVDRRRTSGRFLLTGSANALVLPAVADALTGRVEVLTLWPLSQGELEGAREGFIDLVFGEGPLPAVPASEPADLAARVLRGCFPEAHRRPTEERRRAWFQSYIETLVQRDIRELATLERTLDLPRLLGLLSAQLMGLLNVADLSRRSGIAVTTLRRHLALFEAVFLVRLLPAWSKNLGKRHVRAPKLMWVDTGLAAFLRGTTEGRLSAHPEAAGYGHLLECFVAMELLKASAWSATRPRLHHFRTHAGHEVDLVLEAPDGRLVGIEVKAAADVSAGDFKGLKVLREEAGAAFHRGVVLYTGTTVVPFGEDLLAVPISALWRLGAVAVGRAPAEPTVHVTLDAAQAALLRSLVEKQLTFQGAALDPLSPPDGVPSGVPEPRHVRLVRELVPHPLVSTLDAELPQSVVAEWRDAVAWYLGLAQGVREVSREETGLLDALTV